MFASARSRICLLSARPARLIPRATYTSTAPRLSEKSDDPVPTNDPNPHKKAGTPAVSETNATPVDAMGGWDPPLQEAPEHSRQMLEQQAPNRKTTWSRSQQDRETAMAGPRFEQTMIQYQPRPYAAIELIHKQPVRWTHERVVSCDGGGGPLGHPRIFINTDKPQVCWCEYCGIPFANEHNRKEIEANQRTTYPLESQGDAAEVNESQRITEGGFEQR